MDNLADIMGEGKCGGVESLVQLVLQLGETFPEDILIEPGLER